MGLVVARAMPRPVLRKCLGLTLIEMLITLAIVSALVTLIAQALAQVQRIERLLEMGQADAQLRAIRMEQLRSTLEAALPLPAGSAGAFGGDASQLSLVSSDAPSVDGGRLAPVRLMLRYEPDSRETSLVVEVGDDARRTSWTVQRWPGRSGRFNYLDAGGEVHDAWPVTKAAAGKLPAVLVIDPDNSTSSAFVMKLGATSSALPSRRDVVGE